MQPQLTLYSSYRVGWRLVSSGTYSVVLDILPCVSASQRLGVPVKARPPLLLQLLAIRLYKRKVTATSTVCDFRYNVILIRVYFSRNDEKHVCPHVLKRLLYKNIVHVFLNESVSVRLGLGVRSVR